MTITTAFKSKSKENMVSNMILSPPKGNGYFEDEIFIEDK